MEKTWFELAEHRRRKLSTAVWIPLRMVHTIEAIGKQGYNGSREDFWGAGSLAVSVADKDAAMSLDWTAIGIRHNHAGYVQEGRYVPCDVYEGTRPKLTGLHLVLDQRATGGEIGEWHLHQDFVTTLALKREGDTWIRPSEDYREIARLRRADDGDPYLLEVRASHLRDYLCARGMGLIVNSYRERSAIIEDARHIDWPEDGTEEITENDRWSGTVAEIHEGGHAFGSEMLVVQSGHVGIDPKEDVPVLPHPMKGQFESASWTQKSTGLKLYRVWGEVWKKDWIGPADSSPIVRGDDVPSTVAFVIDAEGKTATRAELGDSGRWLWFKPTVVNSLINRRGGDLKWFTRDTGLVECSPNHGVHFGLNNAGLVTAYAKDVALLPEWQQRIWAAHNVGPEGGVSEELQASQIRARPASTQAPEKFLERGLARLQQAGETRLGVHIFRQHDFVAKLIPTIHRFRAIDRAGLLALAKDLARIIADDVDQKALQSIVAPARGERWGSLKSLQKVLATKIGDQEARSVFGPLFGIYELRGADAHLPGDDVTESLRLAGVNEESPLVFQGFQLLGHSVHSLYVIAKAIEEHWPESHA